VGEESDPDGSLPLKATPKGVVFTLGIGMPKQSGLNQVF